MAIQGIQRGDVADAPTLDMSLPAIRRVLCCAVLATVAASDCLALGSVYLPALLLLPGLALLLPLRAVFGTVPNLVTLCRVALPVLHGLQPIEPAGLRCAAGLTFVLLDFVDGALARHLQQTSAVGGFLDEEADSFGTLIASAELARLGLAPRVLALHQGCAHYLCVVVEAVACPGFEWHMPFARTLAGVMAVCLIGAFVATALDFASVGRVLGCVGCAVNAASFAMSYAHMACEVLRRRAARRRAAAISPPRFVFATVGSLDSTSGGYIFERLMLHGLLSTARAPAERHATGGRLAHLGNRLCSLVAPSPPPSEPPWECPPELWELARDHPLFEKAADGADPPLAGAARAARLMPVAEAAAKLAALPNGSLVVLDGLALLELADAVEARPAGDLVLVAFEHYPFATEVDASARTRRLCHQQEWAVLRRCAGIVAASGVTRAALIDIYPQLDGAAITVLRPPHRFESSPVPLQAVETATGGGLSDAGATRPARVGLVQRPARSPSRVARRVVHASPPTSNTSGAAAAPPDASSPHCVASSPAHRPLHLLAVANVIPRKNLGAILRVLSQLERSGELAQAGRRGWWLSVAGCTTSDAAHAASLRATAESLGLAARVEWLGLLDDDALVRLYTDADLFLLTSAFENYCMAAQEASFFGLPILAYDVGELSLFGAPGGCHLVPVGDEAALAAALDRLLASPQHLTAMRRAAAAAAAGLRARLQEEPSIEAAVTEFEHTLRRAIGRASASASAVPISTLASASTSASASCRAALAPRLALLLLLYALQGLVFGFIGGALPVLLHDASLASLSGLSLTLWPFALKALLAPLVDVLWTPLLGRRKTWVVPCTALGGLLLALLAPVLGEWIEERVQIYGRNRTSASEGPCFAGG